jgi:hypothetical protein
MSDRLPIGAYITIALLMGMVALISWLAATYPDQPSQGTLADTCKTIAEANYSSYQNKTPASNPALDTERRKSLIQDDPREKQDEKTEADRRLAQYTCELAIYTANLAGFTKWLVLATFGLGGIGAWQALQLARTVNMMDDTAERQLRAYVSAIPNHIFAFNETTTVCIRYTISNHGLTPAYDMTSLARVDVLPYPLPPNWPFENPPANIARMSESVVYSDKPDFARTYMRRILTRDEIEQVIKADECRIYVYGLIRYIDAFKKPHTSRFCYSVIGGNFLAEVTSGKLIDYVSDMIFEAADQHNDAD